MGDDLQVTPQEAAALVGRTVLYDNGGHPVEVVILTAADKVFIEWGDDVRRVSAAHLSLIPGKTCHPDPLVDAQAAINEFSALVIQEAGWEPGQAEAAINALRELNWASGLAFRGALPVSSHEEHTEMAVGNTRMLASRRMIERMQAMTLASRLKRSLPGEATVVQQASPGTPALVYLVAHDGLRAAKVGVSEADGSRIAQHRRQGWRLVAAVQVRTGKTAVSIEREVLQWWRTGLGLPACVRERDMPQGGWTETVDLGRVDLAATVARICELGLFPAARPRPPRGY